MPAAPALVLCAGIGSRLRPLTFVRAKAAVPVAGEPLARRILAWLERQGVRDLVVNLHHRPETLTRVVGDGADLGVRVRYSWEQPLLGSAGGPRRALPLLAADRFFIVNGDTLTDVDLSAVWRTHVDAGALVTMALVPNPDPRRYGGVIVENGWVRGFTRAGGAAAGFHFIGVQVVEARAFAPLPDGRPSETVNGFYRDLAAAGRLRAFVCDAAFHDIGTARDYLTTSLAIAAAEGRAGLPAGEGTEVDPTARVVRTALWDRVTVGAGAELVDCVVADGARVPAGARFDRQVIVPAEAAGGPAGELAVTPLQPS
jgi:NDP-sugar pyrophosphorylase family protein